MAILTLSELTDNLGNKLVSQVYDPQKWVYARDALFEAIESAHLNGHQLYEFNQQIPIIGGINEEITRELSLRAAITEPFNTEISMGILLHNGLGIYKCGVSQDGLRTTQHCLALLKNHMPQH